MFYWCMYNQKFWYISTADIDIEIHKASIRLYIIPIHMYMYICTTAIQYRWLPIYFNEYSIKWFKLLHCLYGYTIPLMQYYLINKIDFGHSLMIYSIYAAQYIILRIVNLQFLYIYIQLYSLQLLVYKTSLGYTTKKKKKYDWLKSI